MGIVTSAPASSKRRISQPTTIPWNSHAAMLTAKSIRPKNWPRLARSGYVASTKRSNSLYMKAAAIEPSRMMAMIPSRYGERATNSKPDSIPPPMRASGSSGGSTNRPCRASAQCARPRMQGSVPSRNSIARPTTASTPMRGVRYCIRSGPRIAPVPPPAAIGPNRRFASSSRNTSTMKLQNTETTNMLKTDTQMKNEAASQRASGTSLKSR